MPPRTVDDYLKLPYTIEVVHDRSDDHPGWFARVVELPGCMTQADTFEELGPMIEDAMRGWIEIGLEDGQPIPEPRLAETHSGKFVVRLPRSLHRELAEAADRDGVSLNTYISVALGRAVGYAPAPAPAPEESGRQMPAPAWPHVSPAAYRALAAAGFHVEANQLDERLFADWLANAFQQVSAALERGSVRDALDYVEQSRQALNVCSPASPLMDVFHQAACLLAGQIEQVYRLREGLLQQTLVQTRTRSAVRDSFVGAVGETALILAYDTMGQLVAQERLSAALRSTTRDPQET